MKKVFYMPLVMLALFLGCGSEEKHENASDSTSVTLSISGLPAGKPSAQSIPSTVSAIVITVSSDDIETITRSLNVSGQSSLTDTFDVPSGESRKFAIEAKNPSGTVLYRGSETRHVEGSSINLSVTMFGNSPPTANAGTDQSVLYMSQVFLDGSGSSDADGDALSYSWSFVNTPQFTNVTLDFPVAVNPTFYPDTQGDYIISLTVDDGWGGSSSDTVIINSSFLAKPDY